MEYNARVFSLRASIVICGFVAVGIVHDGQHQIAFSVVFKGSLEHNLVPALLGGHGTEIDHLQACGVDEILGTVELAAGGVS